MHGKGGFAGRTLYRFAFGAILVALHIYKR